MPAPLVGREVRAGPRVCLRKALVDQRTEWLQRIHAVLFHHGVPTQAGRLGRLEGDNAREQLSRFALPRVAQEQIGVALAIVEHLNAQLAFQYVGA